MLCRGTLWDIMFILVVVLRFGRLSKSKIFGVFYSGSEWEFRGFVVPISRRGNFLRDHKMVALLLINKRS